MHQAFHFLDCDFLLEEAGVIGTVGKQRHILSSDCTRESLFLYPIYRRCSECFLILLSVITTFRVDKEYYPIYVRGFQGRPGEKLFDKVGSFQQEDADCAQCLAVKVLVCRVSIVCIMMAVEELQGEHPRRHYAWGYIVLILSVRFQQQLAQVVQSCITIYGPGRKLPCKKKE